MTQIQQTHFFRSGLQLAVAVMMFVATGCGEKKVEIPRQTQCPVTGNRCSREYSVVIEGYRIYGCSPACIPSIKSRPLKWIDKIRANGEEPESLADIDLKRERKRSELGY